MGVGVVGIKADHNSLIFLGYCFYLGNDFRGNARTLNHLNARCHGMGFDGGTIVGTDVDVDTQHFALRFFGVKQIARFNSVT